MATKAELEAELAELRRLLADRPDPAGGRADARAGAAAGDESAQTADDMAETEPPVDWDAELAEILGRLDDFAHKKPLVLALGAFALGFLAGRSR